MDDVILKVKIWLILITWITENKVDVPAFALNISNLYPDGSMKGSAEFFNTTSLGFETLPSDPSNLDQMIEIGAEDEYGNNEVCLKNFVVDNLEFSTSYFADISFWDKFPFYGEGDLKISLENVDAVICFYAISNGGDEILGVDKFIMNMKFQHSPVTINGFFKNPDANDIFSGFLNMVSVFLAMWHTYDADGASCLLSPVLQYFVNEQLAYENNTFTADLVTCLQEGTPFGNLADYPITAIVDVIRYISGQWNSQNVLYT